MFTLRSKQILWLNTVIFNVTETITFWSAFTLQGKGFAFWRVSFVKAKVPRLKGRTPCSQNQQKTHHQKANALPARTQLRKRKNTR